MEITVRKAEEKDYVGLMEFLKNFFKRFTKSKSDDSMRITDFIEKEGPYIEISKFYLLTAGKKKELSFAAIVDKLEKAVGRKSHYGLAQYESHIAFMNKKIVGLTIEDHGKGFGGRFHDMNILLTDRSLKKPVRMAVKEKLIINYERIAQKK